MEELIVRQGTDPVKVSSHVVGVSQLKAGVLQGTGRCVCVCVLPPRAEGTQGQVCGSVGLQPSLQKHEHRWSLPRCLALVTQLTACTCC